VGLSGRSLRRRRWRSVDYTHTRFHRRCGIRSTA
jgi:hypothetical protein